MTTTSAALAATAWADLWAPLDEQLGPLGLRAIAALAPQPGERILDVGCGAGGSTLQLAARVGPSGGVSGLDIAPELLGIARRRAADLAHVEFLEGDAQTIDLPAGGFDALYSRFGVMAFGDPVAAFSHLRRALTPDGRLAFVCWRSLAENELDHLPLRAAGLEAKANLTPFTFEDPDRIRHVLAAAGFRSIAIEADDQRVGNRDLATLLDVLLRVGPLGRILRETPALRAAAEVQVRRALEARAAPESLTLAAATWIVTARA